jgi:hypothetical protein
VRDCFLSLILLGSCPCVATGKFNICIGIQLWTRLS